MSYSTCCRSLQKWYVMMRLYVAVIANAIHPQGEENLGMAMTFTLVSQLREELAALVRSRAEKRRKEEAEKERLALEVCVP